MPVCVCGRPGEVPCARCSRPRWERLGEADAEPTGGDTGQGNATSGSQGRADEPPHDCCGTGAGGAQGPTGLDCHLAQVVSLISGGPLPTACACLEGSWRGPRARKALPCPGDLPRMARLRRNCPVR